jgi:hypothetical protein
MPAAARPPVFFSRNEIMQQVLTPYFIFWTLLLAGLLFVPVSKLVWVLSVRRMQRKLGRDLEQPELDGQLRRARFITVFVVLLFSALFNYQLLGMSGGH